LDADVSRAQDDGVVYLSRFKIPTKQNGIVQSSQGKNVFSVRALDVRHTCASAGRENKCVESLLPFDPALEIQDDETILSRRDRRDAVPNEHAGAAGLLEFRRRQQNEPMEILDPPSHIVRHLAGTVGDVGVLLE